MLRVDLDPSGRLILSLVLEQEDHGLVVEVVLNDAVPEEFDDLVLKMFKMSRTTVFIETCIALPRTY